MPVRVYADIRPLGQGEFGEIAYRVMDCVFAVHNEMGRFLNEDIYRDAVSIHIGADAQTEVRVEVAFEEFRKDYFMDLLVDGGAAFELKAVKRIGAVHRSQLLNYLLLCGLSHGKLVNFGGEKVEHEFVNTHLRPPDRTAFEVVDLGWKDPGSTNWPLRAWCLAFLHDVGAGLDVRLYESAVSQFFGGEDAVRHDVEVTLNGVCLGCQEVRLASPSWAFKVTTFDQTELPHFEDQARRFLRHTTLDGIHWINITRKAVTFQSIGKS